MDALTPELAGLIARRFAVLADPNRVRLLDALHTTGEASVGELAGAIQASHANVSKHLQVMLAERMVARRRDGNHMRYWIADPSLLTICEQVCAGVRQSVSELAAVIDSTHFLEA